jgi:hypothetical protein
MNYKATLIERNSIVGGLAVHIKMRKIKYAHANIVEKDLSNNNVFIYYFKKIDFSFHVVIKI